MKVVEYLSYPFYVLGLLGIIDFTVQMITQREVRVIHIMLNFVSG